MALFGSSWLDEPIDDDRPMFGRNWLDETHQPMHLVESSSQISFLSQPNGSNTLVVCSQF